METLIHVYTENMRKLLLLLLTLGSLQGGQAADLSRTIRNRVITAYTKTWANTSFETEDKRREAIIHALRQETTRPLRTITWENFLQEAETVNQELLTYEKNSAALNNEFFSSQKARKAMEQAMFMSQGLPNYARETKGFKYIYVSEAPHGTYSISNQVIKMLQDLRRANPNARILLASEFSIRTSQLNTTPICFAQTNYCSLVTIDFMYHQVHQAAQAQFIDLLGLDIRAEDAIWPQVGNVSVKYSSDDPHLQQIVADYPPGRSYVSIVEDFVNTSQWGVNERNRYWARLIQAVRPYYDIIIVYAGMGHIATGKTSIPNLLAQPFIVFNFLSQEENSMDAIFSKAVNRNMNDMNLSVTDSLISIQDNIEDYVDEASSNVFQKSHINPDKTFYIKNTDIQDPALYAQWRSMYQDYMGAPYIDNSIAIDTFLLEEDKSK